MAIFTRDRITHAEVFQTLYACSNCSARYTGMLSPDVIVVTLAGRRVKLDEVLNRYERLFPHSDPWDHLPAIEIKVQAKIINVEHCGVCIPTNIGNPQCENPYMPHEVAKPKQEGNYFNGAPDDEPKKRKSKLISRETEEQRARRLKLQAIEDGSLGAMLTFGDLDQPTKEN